MNKRVWLPVAVCACAASLTVVGAVMHEARASAQASNKTLLLGAAYPWDTAPVTGVQSGYGSFGWYVEARTTTYTCVYKTASLADATALHARLVDPKVTMIDCRGSYTAPGSKMALRDLTTNPPAGFSFLSSP